MIRVALVGPYPVHPDRIRGGVESSFATLASALAAFPDVDPHVMTFVPGLAETERREGGGGVPVSYLPAPRRLRSSTLHVRERRSLRRELAALRPDVVHGQDTLQYGFMCLKTEQPAPVVLSIHGIARAELRFAPNLIVRLRVALAISALERYCIRNARYLTEPTRYPEEFFGDEIRGRIWDVGNPISDDFFSLQPKPEPGRILYAGSFIPRKRVLDLVEAMPRVLESLPGVSLRAVGGDSDPEYANRVRARVRELGLEQRVSLVHGLSYDELVDEYRRASLLVLPSGEETSPMVIGEAMAAGVPVVATRVGGVGYLVDEGSTGYLVEPGDVTTLAERIVDVVSAPQHAAAMGAAGRAKADGSFRIEAVAARVRAVYDAALAGAEPASGG
jgi:glycosyltransferase involved in cell wall biosynthesis